MNFFQKLLCLSLIFTTLPNLNAQLKEGYKRLKKEDFENAIKAFERDVFNPKEDVAVEAEHNLSKIYFSKKYENFNLEKAYEYAKSALKRAEKLSTEDNLKIQKRGLGILTLTGFKREIVNEAYNKVCEIDNYSAYKHFLTIFDGPTPIQFEKVTKWRNERALQEAAQIGTWNAFENFYKKYHESCVEYNPHIDTLAQIYMFEAYMKERSWSNFHQFANLYPNNVFVADSLGTVDYLPIAKSGSIEVYKKFLIGQSRSPYAKLAKDRIFFLTMHKEELENFDYFVRTFPKHPKSNTLIRKYYKLFIAKKGKEADKEFRQMYPHLELNKILKF